MSLSGRVAWVTGGGRGIGRACALALARERCAVGLTARTEEELRRTAADCAELGARVFTIRGDVTDAAQVEHAYSEVSKALGPPDILINTAGIARSAPFLKTTPDLLEMHWKVNVLGAFFATQAALPAMVERGWGRVVSIASVAGKVGAPYISAYAASKHGLLGLMRSLAAEFAAKGVTVNAVCPGYVDTPQTEINIKNIMEKTGMTHEQALERLKQMSPQHRLTSAEEVAAVAVFLCSDSAGNINGQAITVDGGALQW